MATTKRFTIELQIDDKGSLRVFDTGAKTVNRFSAEVDKASRSVSSAQGFFASFAGVATGINQALELAGKAFGAFDSVMRAATSAFEQFTAGSVRADTLGDLAAKIGVNVTTLSEFETAARASGTSMEGLAVGFRTLARTTVEAIGGNKEYGEAFDSLGVSMTDASGKVRASEEVFLDIADVFSRSEDGRSGSSKRCARRYRTLTTSSSAWRGCCNR